MASQGKFCKRDYRLDDFEEPLTREGEKLFSSAVVEGFGGDEELLACLESLSEKLRNLQHKHVV